LPGEPPIENSTPPPLVSKKVPAWTLTNVTSQYVSAVLPHGSPVGAS
jgi:hypothetical protein